MKFLLLFLSFFIIESSYSSDDYYLMSQFKPGKYKIVYDGTAGTRRLSPNKNEIVKKYPKNTILEIIKIANLISENRIRGQVSGSLDWVSIKNTANGFMWLEPILENMIGRKIQIIHPAGIQTETVIIGFNGVDNVFFVRHRTPLQLKAFCLLFVVHQTLSTIIDPTIRSLLHGKRAEFIEVDVNTAIFTVKVHNTDLTLIYEIDENVFVSQLIKAIDKEEEKKRKWENADVFDLSSFSAKNDEEQKLKEYFVSDFNAFIDNTASLDYLEIEIPGQILDYLRITSDVLYGPSLFIHRPNNLYLCVYGYNTNGLYGSFSGKKFQLNDDKTRELIERSVSETQWQKIFKLNGNDTFKLKFFFQQYGQNHQVILGEQTFPFLFFEFNLRRPSGENISCKAAAAFQDEMKKKYSIPHFTCTPKEHVNMLENAGIKFKFEFYPSHDIYNIESPLSFDPNFFQKNTTKFDNIYFNFPKNICCPGDQIYCTPNKEYQNLDPEQESCFKKNLLTPEKIVDKENSIVKFSKDTNPAIVAQKPSPSILFEDNLIAKNIHQTNLNVFELSPSSFCWKFKTSNVNLFDPSSFCERKYD